ncbi:MAG TPA: FAD-dependent oxidoreductase [Mycobacteriales bacterium]|nr:FAD-dependent oxidoreductase [Mycobacteriales bacterium]
MRSEPSVAIIGAGSSGIAALKACVDAGLDVTAYEKGDRVGGNWVFRNSNGMSSSYKTLHINTSRERMEYADFPMPKDFPDFPHHSHIARYFQDYVDHFGLAKSIEFRVGVDKATPRAGGGWTLALDDPDQPGRTVEHDVLLVANGHHWDMRWPEPAFPGSDTFTGVQMHAHQFEDNSDWKDKRVVVLGMGNSAMDIAVEASWVAEKTFLSIRTPAHILPKYVFGKPLDQIQTETTARLPWKVRQKMFHAILRVAVGRYEDYGLPKPDHGIMQAHPTISDNILSRMAHGEIVAKPNISHLDGDSVVFTDGSRERADVVVYCTGYRITWPFLDTSIISAPDNKIELYERIWPVDVPDLAFVGLVQPLGAIMPIAERQGKLLAAWLSGGYALPSRSAMLASIADQKAAVAARYVGSKRHTIQVDYDIYMHDLQREWVRGAARAKHAA